MYKTARHSAKWHKLGIERTNIGFSSLCVGSKQKQNNNDNKNPKANVRIEQRRGVERWAVGRWTMVTKDRGEKYVLTFLPAVTQWSDHCSSKRITDFTENRERT